jgi:fluoroacetyl-CoA thioesterase
LAESHRIGVPYAAVIVRTGVSGSASLEVSWEDTAAAARAGDVPVLATPRVIGLCEDAAVRALSGSLDDGYTTVGSRVELAHLAAVGVGSTVTAVASLERCEGRRLVFAVSVSDACGLVAAGKVTRVVVERAAFLERAR